MSTLNEDIFRFNNLPEDVARTLQDLYGKDPFNQLQLQFREEETALTPDGELKEEYKQNRTPLNDKDLERWIQTHLPGVNNYTLPRNIEESKQKELVGGH